MLFYRGAVPAGLPADSTIAALQGEVRYPLRYGYACVGVVAELGDPFGEETAPWLGRRVFAFEPHADTFIAPLDSLIPVPDAIAGDRASLLPNAETAVTLVLDGAPLLGERVAIFGGGIVGLLTTCLLARFPLQELVLVDPLEPRRMRALQAGATRALAPDESAELRDFDLVLELSGNPAALDKAIAATGFSGRVVIGSWYGDKPATLQLGGAFHRSRIRLLSSQVSTLDPALTGRWNRERRFGEAWRLLADPRLHAVDGLISHRIPFAHAPDAYALIERQPVELMQVLLEYD
jgi:2-desacetyl-2-hydroxyethyl bacteriochlorophyllide A dehydrogenase